MNQPPDNPFESPSILQETTEPSVVEQPADYQVSMIVIVCWCLFMLIAMIHFGVCWVLQDMTNGVLFCITGVLGFILIIPTRGTVALASLYAFFVSVTCATQAVIYQSGYHTLFLVGFALTYAVLAGVLGYTEYQQWEKQHA